MSNLGFLIEGLRKTGEQAVVAQGDQVLSGNGLADLVDKKARWLEELEVGLGTPVVVLGDYSFETTALMLALFVRGGISVPLTTAMRRSVGDLLDEVAPQLVIDTRGGGEMIERRPAKQANALYRILIEREAPGLVLFTSGSTGKPKAVVHDFGRLMQKFEHPRPAMRTLNFLMFDHWGGLNTLLHGLSNGALVVLPDEGRNPHDIARLIERHRLELLPATPSFLNLLLLSGAWKERDLSSLKVISYGAEPMPASTLARLREIFPGVELKQTYGMIELGVMRAKSKSSDSLWVKLGGEQFKLRVVDGILQVKADSAMLGYLNAPSPFTDDGYFITGDMVEQEGEFLKILGRASDLINVGGQKVYPAEVESVILEVPGVKDAVVVGERNPLVGKIVVAEVVADANSNESELRQAIRRHCASKLQAFMVPVKIKFNTDSLEGARLKRIRVLPGTPNA